MKKVLVKGGAGFIGSNLVDKLVEAGHRVIVLDNIVTGNLDNIKKYKKEIKFAKIDIFKVNENVLKKYFDKVVKSEDNPNGIPLERFGTAKVKVDYPNFWNDYYPKALDYYEYFQKTFDFVGSSVKGGEEIAMPSVIKIGNKMLLLGGNRRMTYCIINNVLPSVHFIEV